VLSAYVYERIFGRFAAVHLCVAEAMRAELKAVWGVDAVVLYDKAPNHFQLCSSAERHDFFSRNRDTFTMSAESGGGRKDLSASQAASAALEDPSTLFTLNPPRGKKTQLLVKGTSKQAHMSPDRPALLVSSTSWSPDEDFSILLEALRRLDAQVASDASFPSMFVAITGRGPLKAYYEGEIAKMEFAKVTIRTVWLAAEDYPKLLGSSDVGICLHTSSSKLDLPMKVVDMFGCGLPVCALDYDCLHELVKDGVNGLTFTDAATLQQSLYR
jgi:beta-1,4-mannosyltransferase